MFDPSSRYYSVEESVHVTRNGRSIVYKRKRTVPESAAMPIQGVVKIQHGERFDLIAARTLGDPRQFWRIADANDLMNPANLPDSRKQLRIPAVRPQEP